MPLLTTTDQTVLVDTGLEENAFYYYTLYFTTDNQTFYVAESHKVIGLSYKDFATTDGPHWLYDLLDRGVRSAQENAGPDVKWKLRDEMDVIQCGIQTSRGMLDGLQHLADTTFMPAGRVGEAANQYALVEARLKQQGFPAIRTLEIGTMRRVANKLTTIRKNKNICAGLKMYVEALTPWVEVSCYDQVDPDCGGTQLLTFADDDALTTEEFEGAYTGGDISASAGLLENLAMSLEPGAYEKGALVTSIGQYLCVEDNTETEVQLEDTAAVVLAELAVSVTVASSGACTVTTASKVFIDTAWGGFKLKDSGGTVHEIELGAYNVSVDGLTASFDIVGAATPALGSAGLAMDYDMAGVPVLRYRLVRGDLAYLMNPLYDLALQGSPTDPFDYFFGGGTVTLGPFDIRLIIDSGVATAVGQASAVTTDTITVAGGGLTPSAHVGEFVNPNRDQTLMFRVISNTATEITVDTQGRSLTQLATEHANFFVLKQLDALRYDVFNRTVGYFLLTGVVARLYFL